MRGANAISLYIFAACFAISGCQHSRDISGTPEYKPWIGKTVRLTGAGEGGFNVFAPECGNYFIDWIGGFNGYPIIANVRDGHPVVIEAVKRTQGKYLLSNLPFTHDQLILSMEEPEKKKRIRVSSEINFVEPFRDKKGYKDE